MILSETQTAIRDAVRAFAQEQIKPHAFALPVPAMRKAMAARPRSVIRSAPAAHAF